MRERKVGEMEENRGKFAGVISLLPQFGPRNPTQIVSLDPRESNRLPGNLFSS